MTPPRAPRKPRSTVDGGPPTLSDSTPVAAPSVPPPPSLPTPDTDMTTSASHTQFFDELPIATFSVGPDGRVTAWNHAVATLTGRTAAEMVGQRTWKGFSDRRVATPVDEALTKAAAAKVPFTFETADGASVVVNFTVKPTLDDEGEVTQIIACLEPVHQTFDQVLRAAIDRAGTPLMLVDRNFVITYANEASFTLIRTRESEFRKVLPDLKIDSLIGTCIDTFHKNPAHQRGMLTDRARGTIDVRTRIGDLVLSQHVTQLRNAAGEMVGGMMEWNDVTDIIDFEAKLKAVDRAQAMIEFNLDGTIITANANFLATVGYTLEEIKGRHHRMFCDAATTETAAYAAFWEKLRGGQFESGEYKRIGKGGREVWIQASYNPVLDDQGRPLKVVKFATDVTAAKLRNAEFEGKVDAMGKSQAMIEFSLDGQVLAANDQFLATTGYTLEEIKGKHHRMFCDPVYAASPAYHALWAKLRRGEFDSGEYKRVVAGGKQVWLQASYNPILDMNGRPFKVVKFATDITAAKLASAEFQGKVDAIGKAQAVIEFNLDGSIITANAAFLTTLGYTLDEIKGKHHRMFCDPALVATPAYGAFWEKLRGGQFEAGEYKRFGRGGKEVYIQASYNPILDTDGNPFKVVKFATDITEAKRRAAAYAGEVRRVIEGARRGDLKVRGDVNAMDGEYRVMLEGLNSLLEVAVSPMAEVREKLGRVSGGDLTAYVEGDYEGDHALLKDALNGTLDSLNEIMGQVRVAADQIASGSSQVASSSQALSAGATKQAAAVEQITASISEMTDQTGKNAENATQARQLATAAGELAQTGDERMKSMVRAMSDIDESSQSISKIIKVIDEIAFQTNLLALNAAVEAARAGVHGKGFAVVAEEVRNLAARSANAAKETTAMIEGSIKKVAQGSSIAEDTAQALSRIVGSVGKVKDLVAEIAAASNEQAQGITQVDQGLKQVDQVTQQNTAGAEESASAAEQLSAQAGRLRELIGRFNLRPAESAKSTVEFTPELLAALEVFLKQRGATIPGARAPSAPVPSAPSPTARGRKVTPEQARSASTNGRTNGHGGDFIALSDAEFGRY